MVTLVVLNILNGDLLFIYDFGYAKILENDFKKVLNFRLPIIDY